ncbi:host-nuclease inhibitor Gam family protein [Caminicella sporogenes]|uniref:host-nuclease inhibitor Gam family protein n=1 Tax=Caminicella sporogenes TaxID=166485 RepID=UPI0025402A5C|nr:host-nuclease inhibitor Gam family protein [Caminicella sporogenes]WIF95048.1 host-nuclease inhibitor Gam family protein [Caminicella sporogenes]
MLNQLDLLEITEIEEMEIKTSEDKLKERFKITDLDQANWALRKLAALQKKKEEVNELAQKEIDRIKSWQDKELAEIDKSKEFFEGLLTEYLMTERQNNPKFKINTPYGKVSTRKQQPKWEYDEEKAIKSLKEAGHADLIRIKEFLDKNAIKKAVTVVGGQVVDENGIVIEGIKVIEQPEKVVIKVVE